MTSGASPVSKRRVCSYAYLTHPLVNLALKWFDGDGNVAEDYEGGRELEDLVKLCVTFSHPPSGSD